MFITALPEIAKKEKLGTTQMPINKEMDKIWYPYAMYFCLDKTKGPELYESIRISLELSILIF